MIIEAQDGLYYYNPVLFSDQAMLEVVDDELRLSLHPDVTPRKGCASLGIKIKQTSIYDYEFILVTWPTGFCENVATTTKIHLKQPIPVPQKFQGCMTHPWSSHEGLYWNMKFPAVMISNIKAGCREKGTGYETVRRFLGATDKNFKAKLARQELTSVDGYITLRRKDAYT